MRRKRSPAFTFKLCLGAEISVENAILHYDETNTTRKDSISFEKLNKKKTSRKKKN